MILTGKAPLETLEEIQEEVGTIVSMLEKKFQIKFEDIRPDLPSGGTQYDYRWETKGGDDSIWQRILVGYYGNELIVEFESELMSQKDWTSWKESLKPPKLSADVGSDLL